MWSCDLLWLESLGVRKELMEEADGLRVLADEHAFVDPVPPGGISRRFNASAVKRYAFLVRPEAANHLASAPPMTRYGITIRSGVPQV